MKKAGMEATKVMMKSQPASDAVLLSEFTRVSPQLTKIKTMGFFAKGAT
jgi:hypothetical protein